MTNPLGTALRKDWATARVPVPWSIPIEPLRGNIVVILGAPGAGKSALALNWCLKSGTNSTLLSLDTDMATQAIRTASIMGGVGASDVKKRPRLWADFVDRKARMVRTYDITLGSRDLSHLMEAEAEYWGTSPSYLVVDNVQNLLADLSYEAHRQVFIDLHRVARRQHTCILALHHVKRGSHFGQPLALWDGQFAGEQEAEIVLGLWQDAPGTSSLNVSVLKNRSGRADPSGHMYSRLWFDRNTMDIRELSPVEHALDALRGGTLNGPAES